MKVVSLTAVTLALVATAAAFWLFNRTGSDMPDQPVDVRMPELSSLAETGHDRFAEYCAGCHGEIGGGTEQGPPLIHKIYEPSHHADGSFVLAVQRGVRAHHWKFGDMAPVEGVSDEDLVAIVRFVREVQSYNEIY